MGNGKWKMENENFGNNLLRTNRIFRFLKIPLLFNSTKSFVRNNNNNIIIHNNNNNSHNNDRNE